MMAREKHRKWKGQTFKFQAVLFETVGKKRYIWEVSREGKSVS